jgi:hypothetical protein
VVPDAACRRPEPRQVTIEVEKVPEEKKEEG